MHGLVNVFWLFCACRGIDYALSRNEVPKIAKELPSVVRMVNIEKKDDTCLLSAIMVLMNSIQVFNFKFISQKFSLIGKAVS